MVRYQPVLPFCFWYFFGSADGILCVELNEVLWANWACPLNLKNPSRTWQERLILRQLILQSLISLNFWVDQHYNRASQQCDTREVAME